MTDKQDLNEFENHLRSFRPRPPQVDLSTLQPKHESQAIAPTRRPIVAMFGSWSFGAVVGAAVMFLVLRSQVENPSVAPIAPPASAIASNDVPNESDQPHESNSMDAESIAGLDSLLAGLPYEQFPLEAGLSIRKLQQFAVRPSIERLVSDESNKSQSKNIESPDTEPPSPPTRDRLMRDFLNSNSGVY